jgi:two-component system OmpR family sensor kinase
MHQTISERWNRISLRTKITGVTVLMLTLGLLVSGIGTAAMLRSYVEEQTKGKLEAIASGDLMKYFTDEATTRLGHDLDNLASAREDVFVASTTRRPASSSTTTGVIVRGPSCPSCPRPSPPRR